MSDPKTEPAAIAQEVARLIKRHMKNDPRVTWEYGGGAEQVKVNSTVALEGSTGRGGVDYRRRTFYAALETALDGSGWHRVAPSRYRLTG